MCRLTVAPTLLAIALATPLAAGEANVAPFFTSGDLTVALAAAVPEDSSVPDAAVSTLVDITDFDPDTGQLIAARGVAVVGSGFESGHVASGEWQYLDPGDGLWKSLSGCSETDAVVLPLSAQIRFAPDADFNGTANLTIRAWDGIDGSDDYDTGVDTSNEEPFAATAYGGSPTAFSAETRTISMTVTAVNDRPNSISAPQPLNDMQRRSTDAVVTSIVELIGSQTDADGDAVGLAIASLAYTSAYTYAYSLDGESWTDFTAPESGEALCLPRSAAIRITPNSPPTSTIDRLLFTAYAWDGTYASVGGTAALSALATAYAISTYSAGFVQSTVNTSPTWVDAPYDMPPIVVVDNPETPPTSSAQVSDLVADAFSDDDGDPSGIAIIGSTGNGSWSVEWWNGEGYSSYTINAPSPEDPYYLYDDDVLVYTPSLSEPPSSEDEETATLTVRAWDQSTQPSDLTEVVDGGPVSSDTRTIQVGVRVNEAPVIDEVPSGTTVVHGDSVGVPLTASDDGDASSLAWSVFAYSGGSAYFSDGLGSGAILQFTPQFGNTSGSVTFEVTDSDGASSMETITFTILDNAPPEIAVVPASTPAITGRPTQIDLSASDDIDTEALSWTIQGYASNGSASFIDGSGTSARLSFTPSISSGTGSVTVIVTDSDGSTDTAVISFAIVANETPVIVSAPPGSVAVAGQPWEALVTVTDGNAGDADNLSRTGGPSGTWISLQDLGGGRYRFHGTPGSGDIGDTASFSTTFADASNAYCFLSISVTTVSGDAVAVSGPVPPVSTPGSIVYGAIHPGSSSNLAALSSQVVGLGRAQARAFWWSSSGGAFGELPNMPGSPATAGIFLASLSAVTVSFNAPPQAAPYAITLPAQSWSFIGIPSVYTDVSTVSQSHSWDDFRLETAAGVPVEDEAVVAGILGTGTMASTRPWLWNGTAYAQVDTLNTGTAYWVRNRSPGSAYRLVRATSGADATFGQLAVVVQETGLAVMARTAAAAAVASSATAAEQPPAPPSTLSAPAPATSAEGGGGSCGAGGLAGLLLAGLALLGLRPRRRI